MKTLRIAFLTLALLLGLAGPLAWDGETGASLAQEPPRAALTVVARWTADYGRCRRGHRRCCYAATSPAAPG